MTTPQPHSWHGELNPPTDTLATTKTDGWIEEGGSISEEVKIIEQRLLTPVNNAC